MKSMINGYEIYRNVFIGWADKVRHKIYDNKDKKWDFDRIYKEVSTIELPVKSMKEIIYGTGHLANSGAIQGEAIPTLLPVCVELDNALYGYLTGNWDASDNYVSKEDVFDYMRKHGGTYIDDIVRAIEMVISHGAADEWFRKMSNGHIFFFKSAYEYEKGRYGKHPELANKCDYICLPEALRRIVEDKYTPLPEGSEPIPCYTIYENMDAFCNAIVSLHYRPGSPFPRQILKYAEDSGLPTNVVKEKLRITDAMLIQ